MDDYNLHFGHVPQVVQCEEFERVLHLPQAKTSEVFGVPVLVVQHFSYHILDVSAFAVAAVEE